jgi:hypothetical protein
VNIVPFVAKVPVNELSVAQVLVTRTKRPTVHPLNVVNVHHATIFQSGC